MFEHSTDRLRRSAEVRGNRLSAFVQGAVDNLKPAGLRNATAVVFYIRTARLPGAFKTAEGNSSEG